MLNARHISKVLYQCSRLKSVPRLQNFSSLSGNDNVEVNLDRKSGVAVMKMLHKPANTLSLEFLSEIKLALERLEDDRDCRGLILTSGLPNIFSAGIQLTELYPLEDERFNMFWRCLQDAFLALYTSKLATMAAINGHSPAGGCLLSLACDYRLMSKGKYTIGLNEAQLGISVPFWFLKAYIMTIGYRQADQAAMLGTLFPAEKAHQIGLIDHLSEPDQLMADTQTEMAKWLKISDVSRQLIKEQQRRPLYNELMTRRNEDIAEVKDVLCRESCQKLLAKYLEQLKQKSSK